VPTVFGTIARNHDLVPFTDADLVITTRASVRLFRLIRLNMPDIDVVVGLGPSMRAHNAGHGTAVCVGIDAPRGHACM
jgi:hypothetical protein